MQPSDEPAKTLIKISPVSEFHTKERNQVQRVCRICFEGENSSSQLISACKCTGTIKFIHEDCLKKWIMVQVFDPLNYKCDICRTPLRMELKSRFVPSCKRLKSKILRLIVIPLVFSIFTNFTVLIVYLFFRSISDPNISVFLKLFLFSVLISCSFIIYTLIRKFVKAVKIGCCRRKIIHWKIFDHLGNIDAYPTILTENCEIIVKNLKDRMKTAEESLEDAEYNGKHKSDTISNLHISNQRILSDLIPRIPVGSQMKNYMKG